MRRLLRAVWDWLVRIRMRLLLVNVLVVAVPILGIGFARFYEKEMLRSLEDDMKHQAQVVRAALLVDPEGLRLEERESMLTEAAKGTRTRIRLLDLQGGVQSDSHRLGPPEGPEQPPPSFLPRPAQSAGRWHVQEPTDISGRREVREALGGRYGAATRLWENGDRLFLFSALPIVQAGQVQGVVYVTRSTNSVRAALYRFRSTLLRVLLASMAATAVLSLFLAGTISRPLTKLSRVAERIAGGERNLSVALDRRDEIGQLSRAFDKMARNLDARARYVRELAADISHEFKSPLTSLRGGAELLLEGAAEDPAARDRFLRNMLSDAMRLDRLVTRLLELSRVEAEASAPEVFDYEALVRETAARCSGACEVVVEYAAASPLLRGRPAQLASALGNLLDNAQQHAAPGSEVRIRVSDGPGGRVRTAVHNQGEPIREPNLARIWERFYTTRAGQGGTGLGLPIVASVAAAHGGAVDVTSSESDGTWFLLDLPKS